MPGAPSLLDRVVEFYTLRRARSAQGRLGASRAEIADLVELARQRSAAAEALFSVGHTVEALRLALESVESTKDAAARYATATRSAAPATPPVVKAEPVEKPAEAEKPADETSAEGAEKPTEAGTPDEKATAGAESADEAKPADAPTEAIEPRPSTEVEPGPMAPATWRDALDGALLGAASREAAQKTLGEAETATVPRLETEITPAHATLFRDLMRARATLASVIAPAAMSGSEIGFTRVWRPLVTTVLVVGGLWGAITWMRPVEGTFVRASATWADSPDFQPERAIDGNDETMWILPDAQTGFLEVRFVPARRIDRITLVNAGNAVVIDRGTGAYGLEIWADGEMERSIDGELADTPGSRAEHEIGVDGVERIRFVVRTVRHLSGGLSELRWE